VGFRTSLLYELESNRNIGDIIDLERFIVNDTTKISWNVELKKDFAKLITHSFEKQSVMFCMYRPFCMQQAYVNQDFNARLYKLKKVFPEPGIDNLILEARKD